MKTMFIVMLVSGTLWGARADWDRIEECERPRNGYTIVNEDDLIEAIATLETLNNCVAWAWDNVERVHANVEAGETGIMKQDEQVLLEWAQLLIHSKAEQRRKWKKFIAWQDAHFGKVEDFAYYNEYFNKYEKHYKAEFEGEQKRINEIRDTIAYMQTSEYAEKRGEDIHKKCSKDARELGRARRQERAYRRNLKELSSLIERAEREL